MLFASLLLLEDVSILLLLKVGVRSYTHITAGSLLSAQICFTNPQRLSVYVLQSVAGTIVTVCGCGDYKKHQIPHQESTANACSRSKLNNALKLISIKGSSREICSNA